MKKALLLTVLGHWRRDLASAIEELDAAFEGERHVDVSSRIVAGAPRSEDERLTDLALTVARVTQWTSAAPMYRSERSRR